MTAEHGQGFPKAARIRRRREFLSFGRSGEKRRTAGFVFVLQRSNGEPRLGITVSPGPAQLFHTTPGAEMLTRFPLALVPGFLVPLAFMVHFVSLWQLRRDR